MAAKQKVRFTRPQRRNQEVSEYIAARTLSADTPARGPSLPPSEGEGVGARSPAHVPAREGGKNETQQDPRHYASKSGRRYQLSEVAAPNPVGDLLAQASTLTTAERKELLARLSLGDQEAGDSREVDMWSAAVYEALVKAAGQGAGAVPGPAIIKRLVSPPSAWKPVADFMETSKLSRLSVSERRSVYGLLARLVVEEAEDFCHWSHAPLGPKVVVQRSRHIAGTVDHAFPGYLRSGLMPVVARSLCRGGAP